MTRDRLLLVAMATATGADLGSFLALPAGGEANPAIVLAGPVLAIGAKVGTALALTAWPWRFRSLLLAIAAVAWWLGALSNVATIR